jgi:hypothetical protein
MQFNGKAVYTYYSWLFLNVISYEADKLIYTHIEIRLCKSVETVTRRENHFLCSAVLFLKPGVCWKEFLPRHCDCCCVHRRQTLVRHNHFTLWSLIFEVFQNSAFNPVQGDNIGLLWASYQSYTCTVWAKCSIHNVKSMIFAAIPYRFIVRQTCSRQMANLDSRKSLNSVIYELLPFVNKSL